MWICRQKLVAAQPALTGYALRPCLVQQGRSGFGGQRKGKRVIFCPPPAPLQQYLIGCLSCLLAVKELHTCKEHGMAVAVGRERQKRQMARIRPDIPDWRKHSPLTPNLQFLLWRLMPTVLPPTVLSSIVRDLTIVMLRDLFNTPLFDYLRPPPHFPFEDHMCS